MKRGWKEGRKFVTYYVTNCGIRLILSWMSYPTESDKKHALIWEVLPDVRP
jgi:hypothetical protein